MFTLKFKNLSKSVLAAVIFSMFIMFTGIETKAECGPGFIPRTLKMEVNGCYYDVFFCVQCNSLTEPGEIFLTGFVQDTTECEQTLTAQEVFTALTNLINTANILTQLCSESMGFIEPCPNHNVNSEYYNWTPVCWNMERRMHYGHERVFYSGCGGALCYNTYYICFNPYQYPGHYEKGDIVGHYLYGIPNCPLESWQVEQPTNFYEPTDCFKFETPCDE